MVKLSRSFLWFNGDIKVSGSVRRFASGDLSIIKMSPPQGNRWRNHPISNLTLSQKQNNPKFTCFKGHMRCKPTNGNLSSDSFQDRCFAYSFLTINLKITSSRRPEEQFKIISHSMRQRFRFLRGQNKIPADGIGLSFPICLRFAKIQYRHLNI